MNIRILCLTALLYCSSSLTMDKQQLPKLPPAKTGITALIGWAMKECGIQEVKSDETQQILLIRAQLIKSNEYSVHQLMQHPDFLQFANRATCRENSINEQLLLAMAANNTARVRELYTLLTGNITVQDMAKKFLEEETAENKKAVDLKGK